MSHPNNIYNIKACIVEEILLACSVNDEHSHYLYLAAVPACTLNREKH